MESGGLAMHALTDPGVWASFLTLSVLEIVLGVDNLVFVALLAGRLPPAQRAPARRLGLALALGTRLMLLGSIAWLAHLTGPVVSLAGHGLSLRDLILIGGGSFLIYKGTHEIHRRTDDPDEVAAAGAKQASFAATIAQIMLLDVMFSLDSIITAVGIAEQTWVMALAIVAAMAVLLMASDVVAVFIERHASVKMLALSFLLLIGTVLVADGAGFHVPRGYLYVAMGFSVLVEMLNLMAARRRRTRGDDMTRTRSAHHRPAAQLQ